MVQSLKYARIERERRFLLRQVPVEARRDDFVQIDDLYIAGTRLRLRHTTSPDDETIEYKLTQKIDTNPGHRIITTIYLDAVEFARFAALPGARLSKRRYRLPRRDANYGIDVFEGGLTGLLLAEIEFEDDVALMSSGVPDFAQFRSGTALKFASQTSRAARSPSASNSPAVRSRPAIRDRRCA